ncbi:hypothetical protein MVEN_00070800 [Mycena venus]|uniref:Uncharacterized protein n=1 Tax=Mycena venus TaxID=2733690 RepID=A0A8H6Z3W7_9AGAR|nr:hypothetical protein MVEN_00070800 [Mycena venus]
MTICSVSPTGDACPGGEHQSHPTTCGNQSGLSPNSIPTTWTVLPLPRRDYRDASTTMNALMSRTPTWGDEGGEEDTYQFADLTTVGYRDPDDIEEPLADYDSPPPRRTRRSLNPRPSRSLSPASSPKPLRRGNSRSITVGPVSPGVISRGRSRTPSRRNTNEPSPSRAASRGRSPASRGRSRARRTGNALTPQPPTQAGDAPAAPHAHGPHNLSIPSARGPPPPLPPAHTRPPVSRPAIAPTPVSPRRSPPRTRNGGRNRPPPERLPSPSRDLSSDDSTDEYGRTQEAKRRLEAARVARRYSPAAASTADDDEDMQDYLAEAATNGFREDEAGRKSSRRKAEAKGTATTATKEKGKGRATTAAPAPEPETAHFNPEDVMEEDLMERGYTPGRVPRQILEQLYTLDQEYDAKVVALAASCNKDPATLRRATTPHELRNTSAWNMYLSHHAVHHPKPPGVSAAQYNTDARRAFEALLPGLSKAEMGKTSLVLERLPWLHNWWKELNANHVENLRTKGQYKVQAKKAAEPLIQMAKQLSNTITGFMGDLETKIRVIQMEERGEDASRLFGTIMGDRLTEIRAPTKIPMGSPSSASSPGNLRSEINNWRTRRKYRSS